MPQPPAVFDLWTTESTDTKPSSNVSLRDIANIFFKYWFRMAIIVLTALVAAFVLLLAVPASYQSETKVLVKLGREKFAGLDMTSDARHNVLFQERDQNITNEIEILKDPYLTQQVLPTLRAALENRPPPETPESQTLVDKIKQLFKDLVGYAKDGLLYLINLVREAFYQAGLIVRLSPEEQFTRSIHSALGVEFIKQTDVISITFNWTDPYFAQFALNTYLDEYIRQHIRVHQAGEYAEFYEGQIARAEAALDAVQEQLAEYVKKGEISSVDVEKAVMLEFISDLERARNEADLALSDTKLRRQMVKTTYHDTEEWLETPDVQSPFAEADALDREFVKLVAERTGILKRYDPASTEAQRVIEQIDQLRDQKYRLLQNHFEIRLTTLEEKIAALDRKIATRKDELGTLAQWGIDYEELQDERKVLAARLAEYYQKLENLRVGEQLNDRLYASIRTISPPTLPVKPNFPRVGLVLIFAVVLGIMFAASYAILAELFNHTFRNARDVERVLKLPLLGTVPEAKS